LRLRTHGFDLVADDRVDVAHGIARPPAPLAGLLEVRGLGIFRLPFVPECRLALVVDLATLAPRLPQPERHPALNLPLVRLDAALASAPERIMLALDSVLGRAEQLVGTFVV
jgi:HPr kinase/phosphorylase